jgi:hypothetical protein
LGTVITAPIENVLYLRLYYYDMKKTIYELPILKKLNPSLCKRNLYRRIVKMCMNQMETMKHISLYYTNSL